MGFSRSRNEKRVQTNGCAKYAESLKNKKRLVFFKKTGII